MTALSEARAATLALKKLDSGNRCATVAQRLRQPLAAISRAVDPATFIQNMRLTLSQLGLFLGDYHPNGHGGRAYTKSAMSRLVNGHYTPTPDVLIAFESFASALLRERSNGRIRAELKSNKRGWRWKFLATCVQCNGEFETHDMHTAICKKCKRKATR